MQVVHESVRLTACLLRARDVHAYEFCELATEVLICSMVVFSPWAFGTTEPWSIWTMNACGYCLGALLVVKLRIGLTRSYAPGYANRRPIGLLVVCTAGIVAYCLVAALNARATYLSATRSFEYHNHVDWLPASFDSRSSWAMFWRYLALGCSFWATWHWLQGRSRTEASSRSAGSRLPGRFDRLMWVLTVSGAVLALEGIVQRLSGSSRLLFLVSPQIHKEATEQFASFAYRANAGQYFNLLWPVCLGFWYESFSAPRTWNRRGTLVLVCTAVMAACPMISSARGAAATDLAMVCIAVLLLVAGWHWSGGSRGTFTVPVLFLIGAAALGLGLGWNQLRPRLSLVPSALAEREALYEPARRIAADYPLFGTGPGSFEAVFQLYRNSPEAYWPAQLHNDWLETRLTFGWLGTGLILSTLILVLRRWSVPGGVAVGTSFVLMLWLALAGCAFQARWDFPLQVYSILFLLVLWCAVLCTLSRGSPGG